jgi:hypothetical protein
MRKRNDGRLGEAVIGRKEAQEAQRENAVLKDVEMGCFVVRCSG